MHISQNFNLECKMPKIQILQFNIDLLITNHKSYKIQILRKDKMIIYLYCKTILHNRNLLDS